MPGLTGHLNGVCVYGLLFLPAAGYRDASGVGGATYELLFASTSKSSDTIVAYMRLSSIAFYGQYPWWTGNWGSSVRLASVVSGLTVFVPACCGVILLSEWRVERA